MSSSPQSTTDGIRGTISDSLKLLCVCSTEPNWTGLSMQLSRLGCTQPRFRWCSNQTQAAEILREVSFDLVLVGEPGPGDSDPLTFVEALHQGGADEAVLIVSPRVDDSWLIRIGERDLPVMSAAGGWNSRALGTWIVRTVRLAHDERERQRLHFDDVRRRTEVRDDFEQSADQLARIGTSGRRPVVPQIAAIARSYSELLQTYVFFGHGRLDQELDVLARELAGVGLTAGDVVQLHSTCSRQALERCGARSTRSLQGKMDLLLIEVLARLADEYRRRGQLGAAAEHGIDLDALDRQPS